MSRRFLTAWTLEHMVTEAYVWWGGRSAQRLKHRDGHILDGRRKRCFRILSVLLASPCTRHAGRAGSILFGDLRRGPPPEPGTASPLTSTGLKKSHL
jgi:hypothetical protein